MGRPDVVLLVTGSTHGKMEVCNCAGDTMAGGLSRRGGLVASYRAVFPHTLLIDTGDVFWIDQHDIVNLFVMKAYRRMGYDAVVLGDQEWLADNAFLKMAMPAGDTKYLSTTVTPKEKDPPLPLAREIRRTWGTVRLAVLSDIRAEAFLFFPKSRYEQLDFTNPAALKARIAELKKAGYTVVVAIHGGKSDTAKAVAEWDADLFLRGHSEKSSKTVQRIDGKPVVQVAGPDYVAAVALKIQGGRIAEIEYRLETVDKKWPVDKRMLEIYQAYAHTAMRKTLDAKRKKGLDFVSSETCGQCHARQYETWRKSKHADAWRTLEKVKRTGDPNCATCHTLGFGMEKGFYTYKTTPKHAGVNCQSCHRFSVAEHQAENFKRPKVDANTCTTCHTPVTDPKFQENLNRRFKAIGRNVSKKPATRPSP